MANFSTRSGLFALCLLSTVIVSAPAQASLVISSGGTQNVSCSGGICVATAKKAVLNVDDLATMLGDGDVTVESGNLAKDIELDAPLSWNNTHRLTLDSYRSIAFGKPLVASGQGGLTIATGDGVSGGDFQFTGNGHVEFKSLKSGLKINGNDYTLISDLDRIPVLIRHHVDFIALARNYDAGGTTRTSLFGAPDIFEGLGNRISNLTIRDASSGGDVGLFSDIDVIRDLTLLNADVVGSGINQRVGAFAGEVLGAVVNSRVTGSVTATGLNGRAGGVTGANLGSILRTRSDASVSAGENTNSSGGLVGQNAGLISLSFSTGVISGVDGVAAGGLVGYNFGGTLLNSYAIGAVTSGDGGFAGGLIGLDTDWTDRGLHPILAACYSTGTVSGAAMIGGLIGQDVADSQIADTYWDLDTSGVSDPHRGAGNVVDDHGITGLTTEQFTSALPEGLKPSIWRQKTKINGGYPYLIDNQPK